MRRNGSSEKGSDSNPETMSYFAVTAHHPGPQTYLDRVQQARQAVDIPVIASLNGITDSGWTEYARLFQEAGASALELNVFFVPSDLSLDGAAVERRHIDILRAVKRVVTIPVAVKLAPYFSAVGHLVRQLDEAGADGCVLFNRFYQPDIDLASLALRRDLELSTRAEIRLPLLWVGILAGKVRGSLAAASGVETADEVVKFLLAGADTVMTTSALLRYGIGHMRNLLNGLTDWLDARNVAGVGAIRGRLSHSQRRRSDRVRACQLHQHPAGLVGRKPAVSDGSCDTRGRGFVATHTRAATGHEPRMRAGTSATDRPPGTRRFVVTARQEVSSRKPNATSRCRTARTACRGCPPPRRCR